MDSVKNQKMNYVPLPIIISSDFVTANRKKCKFTTKYWDYERQAEIDYSCKEDSRVNSDKCIFHDENYLQLDLGSVLEDKKSSVIRRLMDKVSTSIAEGTALFCIGYHLPDVTIGGNFTKPAYFKECRFQGRADFRFAKFSEADFQIFIKDKADFNYVLFEDGKKILFGIEDLSRVSFMNTDITRVRFNDRARWGREDKFKVVEEETLEKGLRERKNPNTVSLGSDGGLQKFAGEL